jgi:hypothetical protein
MGRKKYNKCFVHWDSAGKKKKINQILRKIESLEFKIEKAT